MSEIYALTHKGRPYGLLAWINPAGNPSASFGLTLQDPILDPLELCFGRMDRVVFPRPALDWNLHDNLRVKTVVKYKEDNMFWKVVKFLGIAATILAMFVCGGAILAGIALGGLLPENTQAAEGPAVIIYTNGQPQTAIQATDGTTSTDVYTNAGPAGQVVINITNTAAATATAIGGSVYLGGLLPAPGFSQTSVASDSLFVGLDANQVDFLTKQGINNPVCEPETSFREGWELCMDREIRQQASVAPGQVTLSNNTRVPSGNALRVVMFPTSNITAAFESRLDALGNNDSEAFWATGFGLVTSTIHLSPIAADAGNVLKLAEVGQQGLQGPAQQIALLRQAGQVIPFAVVITFAPPDQHNTQIQFGPTSFIDSDGHEGAKEDGSGSYDWIDSGWKFSAN